MPYPSREEAMSLLTEFTTKDALIKHALAVEAAMRVYAARWEAREDEWGVTGLLHDFDYERYPSLRDHPFRGAEILRQRGYPEDMVRAILGHGAHTGVPRETRMAQCLFAVDELCGFVTAVALVRPSRSVSDVEVSSVKKKLKDKSFAANVSREDILQGAKDFGVEIDDHIRTVIEAMRGVAAELGL